MTRLTQFVLGSVAAAAFIIAAPQASTPSPAKTAEAAKDKAKDKAKAAKHEAAPAPTAAEITDAKAKGLVWVNLNSGVYRKDGELYGKTKHGKFMTEAEAQTAGHKMAKEPGKKMAKAAKEKAEKK